MIPLAVLGEALDALIVALYAVDVEFTFAERDPSEEDQASLERAIGQLARSQKAVRLAVDKVNGVDELALPSVSSRHSRRT